MGRVFIRRGLNSVQARCVEPPTGNSSSAWAGTDQTDMLTTCMIQQIVAPPRVEAVDTIFEVQIEIM